MMKYQVYLFSFFFLFSACKAEEKKQEIRVYSSGPVISSDGRSITFPDRESISFFKTDSLRKEKVVAELTAPADRKSTRLNSSHVATSYAVFCLKKKNKNTSYTCTRRSCRQLST